MDKGTLAWVRGMLDAKMGTDYDVQISDTGGEYIIYADTDAGRALKAEHDRIARRTIDEDDCPF